jgi:GT2 family glycosyltransferase
MPQPLVSVIVPTFNRAYCLGRTLDSALAQTYRAVEVLVIDDGSTDETAELVRTRSAQDARLRYFYQDNRGVSAARNHGLRVAEGEFVAFLDSDDIWKPWKLELQVACLVLRPDVGMVWTDMEAVDPEGNVVDPKHLRTFYDAYRWFSTEQLFREAHRLDEAAPAVPEAAGGAFHVGDIFSPMIMGNLVHTSTVLLRRERVEKVKAFNESWRSGEDHDFHLRTCREGPVGFIDLASIQYQRGMPDRLSGLHQVVAENFLTTVTKVIVEHKERITLPRWMLDHVLAEANAWVGEVLLESGDYPRARGYLVQSLRHHLWQPREMYMLAFACLPRSVGQASRRLLRNVKRRIRGLKQGTLAET